MSTPNPAPVAAKAPPKPPVMMPCLLFQRGLVMLPGPEGPEIARDGAGEPIDLFEVSDYLSAHYRRVFVVDLDGVERGNPQLDWLQELSRTADTWVDAGVDTGDQVIDVLVTGARRAILSTGDLRRAKEAERAWAMTTNLGAEIEVRDGKVVARAPEWNGREPEQVALDLRGVGLTEIILAPRPDDVDWELARRMARQGPLWVGGSFDPVQEPRLAEVGAKGGIFHIAGLLRDWAATRARDDAGG